jgi:hypothetical protein
MGRLNVFRADLHHMRTRSSGAPRSTAVQRGPLPLTTESQSSQVRAYHPVEAPVIPKLRARVRFPSSAPQRRPRSGLGPLLLSRPIRGTRAIPVPLGQHLRIVFFEPGKVAEQLVHQDVDRPDERAGSDLGLLPADEWSVPPKPTHLSRRDRDMDSSSRVIGSARCTYASNWAPCRALRRRWAAPRAHPRSAPSSLTSTAKTREPGSGSSTPRVGPSPGAYRPLTGQHRASKQRSASAQSSGPPRTSISAASRWSYRC